MDSYKWWEPFFWKINNSSEKNDVHYCLWGTWNLHYWYSPWRTNISFKLLYWSYFETTFIKEINDMGINRQKLMWLHLDNCWVHNSKSATESLRMLAFKRAHNHPYSLDLAPLDFALFVYIKEKLKGCFFNTIEELKAKIILILEEISEEKRNEFFLSWIKLCDWVASYEWSYYKE